MSTPIARKDIIRLKSRLTRRINKVHTSTSETHRHALQDVVAEVDYAEKFLEDKVLPDEWIRWTSSRDNARRDLRMLDAGMTPGKIWI